MSKYFRLEELLKSETALKQKIENLPSWEVVEHLNELAEFLDGLREAWGGPILVTSGFRSTELNGAVKGVQLSAHKLGYAADLIPSKRSMDRFKKTVVEWIKDKKFDQCIIERKRKDGAMSEWIHISLYNQDGEQRCEVFDLNV